MKRMKKQLAITALLSLLMISCKKEGCIYSYATNYEKNAKVDDGSCIFYSSAKITYISCSSWPSTNIWGNPWDPSDDPDTYLAIYLANNLGSQISYEGPIINNNPGNIVEFTVDMFPIDSLNQSIRIALEDEDGFLDSEIQGENINLWDYTHEGGNSEKYPTHLNKGNFYVEIEWFE